MDDFHDKVHDAAEKLKKALEEMGADDVVIMYAYHKDQSVHTGGTFANILKTVGALEIMKHDLLFSKDD